jgi:hypothetical protein
VKPEQQYNPHALAPFSTVIKSSLKVGRLIH